MAIHSPAILFVATHLVVLQYNPSLLKPSSLQYKNCIAIQFSIPTQLAIQSSSLAHPRPLYHNTMPFLQYKNFTTIFLALSLAIQLQGLQYKIYIFFSSSQYNRFCSKFFFLHYNFFYLFISSSWKIHKKSPKIINFHFFFILFYTQINLHLHLSPVLHHIKP